MQTLLLLAVLMLAAAVYLVGEVVTLPGRERNQAVRRAATYGRSRVVEHGDRAASLPRARPPARHGLARRPHPEAEPAHDTGLDLRSSARRGDGPQDDADHLPRAESRGRARRRLPRVRRRHRRHRFGRGAPACDRPRPARLHRPRLRRLDASPQAPGGLSARSCPTRSTCWPSRSRPDSASTARLPS